MIKVIKSYTVLKSSINNAADLSYDDDRATADFRAFYAVANVHVQRVQNPLAKDVMIEVLDKLKAGLNNRLQVT